MVLRKKKGHVLDSHLTNHIICSIWQGNDAVFQPAQRFLPAIQKVSQLLYFEGSFLRHQLYLVSQSDHGHRVINNFCVNVTDLERTGRGNYENTRRQSREQQILCVCTFSRSQRGGKKKDLCSNLSMQFHYRIFITSTIIYIKHGITGFFFVKK